MPGGIGAIIRDLFEKQIAGRQIHAAQDHALQKRFIHCPNDLADLALRPALLLPRSGRLSHRRFQPLHDASEGGGRTAHLGVEMQPRKKLAHGLTADPALEPKRIQSRDDQTRQPLTPVFGFPQPGFGMAVAALHGLLQAVHTALGQARLVRKLPYALGSILTQTLDNSQAFIPKSHVGQSSDDVLNSWRNSAPQRT